MKPIFFPHRNKFRKWLEKNHVNKSEVYVGYYKVDTGKPTLTWSESVDEALCFGWIDGVRKSIDTESYCNRFTPRRPTSNWSAVNIKKVNELIKKGLMKDAGLKVFHNRKKDNTKKYSYENKPEKLPKSFETIFRKNKKAWDFFESLPTSYRKTVMFRVLNAVQEKTQLSRRRKLIKACSQKKRIL